MRGNFVTFWFIHLKAINWASPPFKKETSYLIIFYHIAEEESCILYFICVLTVECMAVSVLCIVSIPRGAVVDL